jgi:hypothetical protein
MNAIRKIEVVVGLALLLIAAQPGAAGKPQKKAATVVTAKADALTVGNKMYDAEKELARLTKRYSLSEDQKTKIQPILLEQQQQVHALGEDDALGDTEWAAAVRKVHTQTVAKVKLELTDAQATKYAKDEAKRAKSNGDSDDGDDGPPGE